MPNIHPAHLRRAFRRAVQTAETHAALAKEGATPAIEAARASIRREAARMSDAEINEHCALLLEALHRVDQ